MTLCAQILLGSMAAIGALSLAACKNDNEPVTPDSALTSEPEPADLEPVDPSLQPHAATTPPPPTPPAVAVVEPAPRELDPQTDPEEVDGWRPQWWIEDPMKTQQHAVACSFATDAELAKARATAVDSARGKLAQFLARNPGVTEMKTDAVRLPTGQYRAFVLIQTPLK